MPDGFADIPPWRMEEHGTPEQQLRATLAWAERIPAGRIPAAIGSLEKHAFRTDESIRAAKAFLSARWAEIDPEAAAWECRRTLNSWSTRTWIDPWAGLAALAATKPAMAMDAIPMPPWRPWVDQNSAAANPAMAVAFELSRKYPDLAWQLYESRGKPPLLATALVQSLWLRDRAAAEQLATELGQRGSLARLWAGESPAEAFRWATEATVVKSDAVALRETAELWAKQDLAACRRYCDELPAGPARDALLAPLMRQIGREDWRTGAEWLLTQPPSEGRARTLAQMINARTAEDPEGVSTILRSLPPSDERDTSIQTFVQKATEIEPAAAMNWIGSISDSRKAANLADHQLGNWIKKDPAAATEWLRSSIYATPAMKAKWLKE